MRAAALPLVALLLGSASPIAAQTARTPEYIAAEASFSQIDFKTRIISQVLLIATGHQNSVPTERYSQRTYAALSRFQHENGLYPSGIFDETTVERLSNKGRAMLDFWNFKIVGHPIMGNPIWIPQGMGLQPYPSKSGIAFQDMQKRVFVAYNYFPGVRVEAAYNALREKMAREGTAVHYATAKNGWYVVSATPSNGNDQYIRYHQHGDGILGFGLFWNNGNGNVSGERIAILMSASLGSALTGRPMVEPPGSSGVVNVAKVEMPQATLSPNNPTYIPSATPLPPVVPKAEEKGISTGTGFFVDGAGNLVTNAHVIKDCKTVIVKLNDGKTYHTARVIGTDSSNDLALLAVENGSGNKYAPVRLGLRLGEGVSAFGYPHADVLASSGNFTMGNITAMAGIGDDSRFYQISAPVQSGNSGGPLFDEFGNTVGVVASKLNGVRMAAATGDLPQNVNFAIKGSTLVQFLESNGVSATIGSTGSKIGPADTADIAKSISGFVACQ